MSSFNEIRDSLHVSYGANFILEEEFLVLHLPDVNRKTRNENSQTNTGEYWIWPGSNAITHLNDSQKMNIATAKVIKLKLHVSVPGWPEKNLPQKTP